MAFGWSTKSEGVGLIVRAIQDLQPDPPTSQSDGRTNAHVHGQHAIARPRFAV